MQQSTTTGEHYLKPVICKLSLHVKDIKLPCRMKKRGRPKGSTLTAIGLPKKKKEDSHRPKKFYMKTALEKDRGSMFSILTEQHW